MTAAETFTMDNTNKIECYTISTFTTESIVIETKLQSNTQVRLALMHWFDLEMLHDTNKNEAIFDIFQ